MVGVRRDNSALSIEPILHFYMFAISNSLMIFSLLPIVKMPEIKEPLVAHEVKLIAPLNKFIPQSALGKNAVEIVSVTHHKKESRKL